MFSSSNNTYNVIHHCHNIVLCMNADQSIFPFTNNSEKQNKILATVYFFKLFKYLFRVSSSLFTTISPKMEKSEN